MEALLALATVFTAGFISVAFALVSALNKASRE